MCAYPSSVVSVKLIDFSHPVRRRVLLRIRVKGGSGKTVLFIMMNPSKATDRVSDTTVNKVITYASQMCSAMVGVSNIYVLNLYTVYETVSGDLGGYIKRYGFEFCTGNDKTCYPTNDSLIAALAAISDFTILAWGRPTGNKQHLIDCKYHYRVITVLRLLKSFQGRVYHLDNKLSLGIYPKHPVKINYLWTITKLDISNLINRIRRYYG